MRRRLIVAGLLGLAAITVAVLALTGGGSGGRGSGSPGRPGPSPPAGAGPAAPGIGLVGVNVNRVFNDLVYTPAQEAALMRSLAATGATVARSDTLWEVSEPARGRWDWSFDDNVAGTLAAAGLRWLPLLDYAPAWAKRQPGLLHAPPANPADYAAFAAELVHRYGPDGTFWAAHPALHPLPVMVYEIWNEPDTPLFWSPAPDPAAYARLYAAARTAIHGADPAATVLVGGLTRPVGFLPELLAADPGLRGAVDGVAIHPYDQSVAAVLRLVRRARDALRGVGLGAVPLYLTEFGWVTSPSSSPHYTPAAARPALLRATVAALGHTDCGVAGEIVYTWVTPRRRPGELEDWYGLEPPGGGPSADATALTQGIAQARAPAPRIAACG